MVRAKDKIVADFIGRVKKKYTLDQAILFGSRARGDFLKHSDYDLILVSSDFEGVFFTHMMGEVAQYWKGNVDVEPLCYTPEEFKLKKKESVVLRAALKEGISVL